MTFAITLITSAMLVAVYAVSMSVDKQPRVGDGGDADRDHE
jgi:hypothetical protein